MGKRAAPKKSNNTLKQSKEEEREEATPSKRPKRASAQKEEPAHKHIVSELGLEWEATDQMFSAEVPYAYTLIPASDSSLKPSNKLAAFDMDYCLIKCKSGQKWPKNASDWVWLYPSVPDKLRQLHKDGFRLMLITNQGGIKKNRTSAQEIMDKVEQIIADLNVPMLAFIACGENQYRKPSVAAWKYMEQHANGDKQFDLKESCFIGDAAGRPVNYVAGRKKDFSCSDRKFAHNIGVAFHTPEEFFLKEGVAPFDWGCPEPASFLKDEAKVGGTKKTYHSSDQEVIVMVGAPASGKSTFVKKHLIPFGYEWINRDTMKTAEKCLKMARLALEDGKSVAVDNTNPNKASRGEYVKLAAEFKIPVRCFVMDTPLPLARHMNYFRQSQTNGEVRRVPDTAYNVFKSRLEPVDASKEGFAEAIHIDFEPQFQSVQERKDFLLWQC